MVTPANPDVTRDHEDLAALLLMAGKRKGAVKAALAATFGLSAGACHEIVVLARTQLVASFNLAAVDTWLATASPALAAQLGQDRATILMDSVKTYREVLNDDKLFPILRLTACVRIFALTGLGWQHRLETKDHP